MQNENTYQMQQEYCDFASVEQYVAQAQTRMSLRLEKLRNKDDSEQVAVKQNTKEYCNA